MPLFAGDDELIARVTEETEAAHAAGGWQVSPLTSEHERAIEGLGDSTAEARAYYESEDRRQQELLAREEPAPDLPPAVEDADDYRSSFLPSSWLLTRFTRWRNGFSRDGSST